MFDVDSRRQVLVTVKYDNGVEKSFECDYLIAPLIRKLNENRLYTRYCCSSHEDERFLDMYIYFSRFDYEGNEELDDKLNYLMVNSKKYFDFEHDYRLGIWTTAWGRRMHLKDPTVKDLDLATKLAFKEDFDDVFFITKDGRIKVRKEYRKYIDKTVTFRTKLSAKRNTRDSDEFTEENYEFVMEGVNRLNELLRNYR